MGVNDDSSLTLSFSDPTAGNSDEALKTEGGHWFELKHVDMCVRPGQLCMVVGSVGAGKSTLLKTILSELLPIQGEVNIRGRIAYCSQQAWIQSGTVLTNILMGREFSEELLAHTIKSACLQEDIVQWPKGLHTEIGMAFRAFRAIRIIRAIRAIRAIRIIRVISATIDVDRDMSSYRVHAYIHMI